MIIVLEFQLIAIHFMYEEHSLHPWFFFHLNVIQDQQSLFYNESSSSYPGDTKQVDPRIQQPSLGLPTIYSTHPCLKPNSPSKEIQPIAASEHIFLRIILSTRDSLQRQNDYRVRTCLPPLLGFCAKWTDDRIW